MNQNIKDFLEQSNNIENVWDLASYMQAVKAWLYLIKRNELTEKAILKTHEILMKGKLDPEETGAYRKRPVWIGGHEAKPWYVIKEKMESWIRLANQIKGVDDQSQLSGLIQQDHIRFEAIHPFIDGNGRIGRILLNWQRVKAGLPILVIKESEKEKYYEWFK